MLYSEVIKHFPNRAVHPILFKPDMIYATIRDYKSETRRVITPQPQLGQTWKDWIVDPDRMDLPTAYCPYGIPDDLLWIRETYGYVEHDKTGEDFVRYYADNYDRSLGDWPYPHPIYEHCVGRFGKKIPSIFMFKYHARLWLRIKDVRIERIQDITEKDALNEGVSGYRSFLPGEEHLTPSQKDMQCSLIVWRFRHLWDSINKSRGYGWDVNPRVWVIRYEFLPDYSLFTGD